MRQPLYGNRLLTNEVGVQWGTEPRTTMIWWPQRNLKSLQDAIRPDGSGWKVFEELSLRRTRVTPTLYGRLRSSTPWAATPAPPPFVGQWLAPKSTAGSITRALQVTCVDPLQATLYHKDATKKLRLVEHQHRPLDDQL